MIKTNLFQLFHSFVAEFVHFFTGIMCIVGIAIFRGASNELGEGFWFVTSSSGLYILNGVTLILMPWMDYQQPKWKTAEAVPLTLIKKEENV